MEEESTQKIKTCHSPATRRNQVFKRKISEDGEDPPQKRVRRLEYDSESASSSMDSGRESSSALSQQSAASAKNGQTWRAKRKASPDNKNPRKRARVSQYESEDTSEKDLCIEVFKRKISEDGEDPPRKRVRRLEYDSESASSSMDSGRESSSALSQQSAASAKNGQTWRAKRKASPDNKNPRKRARVSQYESEDTSEKDLCIEVFKGKISEDGENPPRKRVRRLEYDSESASSSMDSGRESSSNTLESCSTPSEDVSESSEGEASADGEGPKRAESPDLEETEDSAAKRAEFEAKYQQQDQLGEGGCGSVFAGYRKADHLPVAIKHILKDKVFCKHVEKDGTQLSAEVAIMLKLAKGTVGTSGSISLLDWYDLDQELILVLERPVPAVDLLQYIKDEGGSLQEEEAKIVLKQVVEAAIELQKKHIFHRDIKVENILIETGSSVPRARLIDFGLGCFDKKGSIYHTFYGTTAHVPPEWFSVYTYRAGPTTVWQMGVVLYEALHREKEFKTTKFLKNKLSIDNKLSKNCQDFLRACLTKDPNQRPTLEQVKHHPWLN